MSETRNVHVVSLDSQPALGLRDGDEAFVIIATIDEGETVALSMSHDVAAQLVHAIETGHLPHE